VTLFLRRHPLAALLPFQALIGFWHLGLLSPWMDEAGTLLALHKPLPDVIAFAAADVHPPFYYLLLYGWLRIPLGLDWAVQARALSVIFALLATVALDALWTRALPARVRWWTLALWSLSPCLLLYSRMCRSYSLQALLICVGAACLLRLAGQPGWRAGGWFTLVLLGALYTHYAPGIALLMAANIFLLYYRRIVPLLAVDAAVAAGYAPWIWRLAASLESWGRQGVGYNLTGMPLLELPVKAAYWAVSFAMGEAVPDLILVLGVAIIAAALWLLYAGARQYRRTAALTGVLTAIGFVGVARWVSYPFVPARMLFVLPFFLMMLAAGAGVHRRAGNLVLGAMVVFSLSGAWCYFHRSNFRNKQYPMPMAEIARYIRENSTAANSVILADSANSDPVALRYALGASRAVVPSESADIETLLENPRLQIVWFLRNTHDVSPGGQNARIEARLRAVVRPAVFYYQPYTLLERTLMQAVGISNPPWYFHELLEFGPLGRDTTRR